MKSQLIAFLVGAVVVLSMASESLAFKCYVCNSHNDTACAKTPLDKRFLVDCSTVEYMHNKEKNPYIVCRHQLVELEGKVHHDRRCGWKMNPKKRETCLATNDNIVKTTMCECHTEGCNSSTSLTISAVTVLASVLSVWLIRH